MADCVRPVSAEERMAEYSFKPGFVAGPPSGGVGGPEFSYRAVPTEEATARPVFTFQPVSTDERVAEAENIEQQIAESGARVDGYFETIKDYMKTKETQDRNAPAYKDLVTIFSQRLDAGAVAVNPALSSRYEFAVSDLLSRRAEPVSRAYSELVEEEKLLNSLQVRAAEVRDSIRESRKQNMLNAMQFATTRGVAAIPQSVIDDAMGIDGKLPSVCSFTHAKELTGTFCTTFVKLAHHLNIKRNPAWQGSEQYQAFEAAETAKAYEDIHRSQSYPRR